MARQADARELFASEIERRVNLAGQDSLLEELNPLNWPLVRGGRFDFWQNHAVVGESVEDPVNPLRPSFLMGQVEDGEFFGKWRQPLAIRMAWSIKPVWRLFRKMPVPNMAAYLDRQRHSADSAPRRNPPVVSVATPRGVEEDLRNAVAELTRRSVGRPAKQPGQIALPRSARRVARIANYQAKPFS